MVALRHVVVVGRQRDLQSCPQLTAAATTDPEYDGFKYADLPVKFLCLHQMNQRAVDVHRRR
jgi:hypothetical protein